MKIKGYSGIKKCNNNETYIFKSGFAVVPGIRIGRKEVKINLTEFKQLNTMTKLENKAVDIINKMGLNMIPSGAIQVIVLALKEQDRNTRHACANAVMGVITDINGSLCVKNDAHNAVMNCREGIE